MSIRVSSGLGALASLNEDGEPVVDPGEVEDILGQKRAGKPGPGLWFFAGLAILGWFLWRPR